VILRFGFTFLGLSLLHLDSNNWYQSQIWGEDPRGGAMGVFHTTQGRTKLSAEERGARWSTRRSTTRSVVLDTSSGCLGPSNTVTTPSEIIPYYHLNHSIWSLSDNKESFCWVLPSQSPVNHLKTQRWSNVCIKTHTKASPECITQIKSKSTLSGLIITNHGSWHDK
jgi:hypothetical protein